MTLVIVETLSETPLTPENLTDEDVQFMNCLEERNGTWRYSLLSIDRQRMICTFEVPDVESLRESYRRSGVPYNHIWPGEILKPEGTQPQKNEAIFKVFEGTYPEGLTPTQWDAMNQSMSSHYAEHGVEWVQSYVSLDRTRIVCELNAPDLESVIKAHHKIGLTKTQLWPATLLAEV
ncbi:DUF4242 domain-containing protein [Acaryochloris sp. CCMEE 5410]|uniref:DUF4242 domain-containing protein n=1 Tax=Acaryochloris sp. CCMEE 5410 TaxID=310037 RepID=UPI0002484A5B|nr:DUF4242 domain-containing protein [Acaryochloris sp. CCMEE 5410]KAI9129193.1 DUF4242 domain-containing protein [Acaryochloris sp. CCMEE 5410]